MNIIGNKIKSCVTDDSWRPTMDSFLKDKIFTYLNITYLGNDRNKIYYILSDEEVPEEEKIKEGLSI